MQAPAPAVFRSAILLAGALVLPLGCDSGGPGDSRRSAVLITLDTTNAWALDCYGRVEGITPNLDALAGESALFENARTVAPLTAPAHASMLTGLYPLRHTVRDNGHTPLPESAVTLAERAREAGYQTAAFLSAIVLAPWSGLDQGFDVYDCPVDFAANAASSMAERSGAETTREAQIWLRGRDRSRPFFLWVHYFDPHVPHEPGPEYMRRTGDRRYLGEVAAMDDAVGDLLASLRAEGAWEDTLVVVAGDHGEALGLHDEPTHSFFCYDSTLRVPLFVRHPDGRDAGERIKRVVSVVDVYPTLVAGLGLGTPGSVDGVDLRADFERGRGVYFESYAGYLNFGYSPLSGWVDRRAKYVHSSQPELFDVRRDPDELYNVFAARADDAQRYRAEIARLDGKPKLAADAGGQAADAELRSRLRALGYAGLSEEGAALPRPADPSALPSPRERVAEMTEFHEALAAAAGDRPRSIERMRALAGANPENVFAAKMLGVLLAEDGRHAEAIETLEGLLANGRDSALIRDHLGHAYEELGDAGEARKHFALALALNPGNPHLKEDVERLADR